MNILKQSTAVDVLIGPFVDIVNGYAAETGESPSVKLSKNGQTLAAKNDATTPVHDADGYYNCELDATDTNTVGIVVLTVAASGTALPVRHTYYVVEEVIYEAIFAATSASMMTLANINAEVVDVMTVDTVAEPGQEAPATPQTLANMLAYLYKAWRNKHTQTSTEYKLYDDAGTTVDHKGAVSDVASTATRGGIATGP